MINSKINTKEKFHEITMDEPHLSANMTDTLGQMLYELLEKSPKNVVLSLKGVKKLDEPLGEMLTGVQTRYYHEGASFVICEMEDEVEEALDKWGILETMNVSPTLSEAWDLVQMEEIERELMDDWDS